jgi:hypothetical protein
VADKPRSAPFSRRSFGKQLVLATAAMASTASVAASNSQDEPFEHNHGLSNEALDKIRERYQTIERQYGSRLTAEQKKHVRQILVENELMLAPIMAFTVQNGDAPADVLKLASEPGEPDAR